MDKNVRLYLPRLVQEKLGFLLKTCARIGCRNCYRLRRRKMELKCSFNVFRFRIRHHWDQYARKTNAEIAERICQSILLTWGLGSWGISSRHIEQFSMLSSVGSFWRKSRLFQTSPCLKMDSSISLPWRMIKHFEPKPEAIEILWFGARLVDLTGRNLREHFLFWRRDYQEKTYRWFPGRFYFCVFVIWGIIG